METIDGILKASCLRNPAATAFRHKQDGRWSDTTYGTLWSESDRVAAGLVRSGFRTGEHAAILAPSSPRWVVAYLGILKAGGVVVPVDKELKGAEIRHVLGDSAARVLFLDRRHLDTVLAVARQLPDLSRLVLLGSGPEGGGGDPRLSRAMEALVEEWHDLVEECSLPPERAGRLEQLAGQVHRLLRKGAGGGDREREEEDPLAPERVVGRTLSREGRLVRYDAFLYDGPVPSPPPSPDRTALILYTSGTTGRSKGAMLSHGNVVSNIRGATEHFRLDASMHTLSFLPINHVFEQVCGILLPLSLGGKVSFCESLKKIGENLAEERPTFFLGVPAVFRLLHDRIRKNISARPAARLLFQIPFTRPLVTARVRKALCDGITFVSGGAALDPEVAEGLRELGFTIYQGYGITETSPVISGERPGFLRPGTVGVALRGVRIRIDGAGEDGVGEIVVHGPNVMQGYWRNPAATAEVLSDGWYRTGDLGRLDAEGCLSICGRVKNLIVTPNGKNVYPEEVENELLKSPFIAEAMVYGHKLSATAEEVHALLYPDQEALDDHARKAGKGTLTLGDVEAILRAEVLGACKGLADYKRVRRFTVREDEFPKTTTRKIKRFAVEAEIPTSRD
jgi:long-chain acyl-CoA synthetase